jgi:hypothetical protein
MIKARMRNGASWSDVCILNISSRGLSLQTAAPPPRGTYLEIRRGQHQITACVVWSKHHRFGVRTQDALPIDAIVHQPDQAAAPSPTAGTEFVERRQSQRPSAEQHERSRMLSRIIDFGLVGAFAASAAVGTYVTVAEAFQGPVAKASAALARH